MPWSKSLFFFHPPFMVFNLNNSLPISSEPNAPADKYVASQAGDDFDADFSEDSFDD